MPSQVVVDQILAVDTGSVAAKATSVAGRPKIKVDLSGGATCLIDPTVPHASHYVRMLGMLRHAGMHVYLETDPNTNEVTRLLIPRAFQVDNIAANPVADRLEVRLQVSHAIHFIKTTNPDYKKLVAALQTAMQQGTNVLVTEEPDRPEIIDVRPANLPLVRGAVPAAFPPAPQLTLFPMVASTVSPAQAQQKFDLVNAQSCPTNMSVSNCIPFLYPDDGCWARAHEMCRIMVANGVTPLKVWLYGTLHVNTNHSPACGVNWGWHVAPILLVDTGTSSDQYVIDPSLFDGGPALLADWIAIQNTTIPPSDTEATDDTVYRTARLTGGSPQYDPGYSQTTADLNTYRMLFANRFAVENPPGPPYACP